ncbi:MAG: hypothetical protein R3F14_24770 [Polyangiaceae bacterium]
MKSILDSLPDWSKTMDPRRSLDLAALRKAALALLEDLSRLRDRYQITAAGREAMLDDGVPAYLVTRLEEVDPHAVLGRAELSALLESILGAESVLGTLPGVLKHSELWRATVAAYSHAYCLPELNLAKASGIYLFFRVIFDLPTRCSIEEVKSFGGWITPFVLADEEAEIYDLSWPVDAAPQAIRIHRFINYVGRPYDAIGEYDFMIERFPFRPASAVQDAAFSLL